MKLNKIAGLIGSGMVLLSAGAYAQSTSEETSGDKKGSAVFFPTQCFRGENDQ
jgi:hemoglobin/transferrin/lactoferrin receptor protein